MDSQPAVYEEIDPRVVVPLKMFVAKVHDDFAHFLGTKEETKGVTRCSEMEYVVPFPNPLQRPSLKYLSVLLNVAVDAVAREATLSVKVRDTVVCTMRYHVLDTTPDPQQDPAMAPPVPVDTLDRYAAILWNRSRPDKRIEDAVNQSASAAGLTFATAVFHELGLFPPASRSAS